MRKPFLYSLLVALGIGTGVVSMWATEPNENALKVAIFSDAYEMGVRDGFNHCVETFKLRQKSNEL